MKLCQVSEDQGRVEEAEPGYDNWPAEQRVRYLEGELAQSSFGLWPAAGEECVEYCKTWFTLLVQEISRSARLGTLLRSEQNTDWANTLLRRRHRAALSTARPKFGTLLKRASEEGTDWASALPSI